MYWVKLDLIKLLKLFSPIKYFVFPLPVQAIIMLSNWNKIRRSDIDDNFYS